MTTKRPAYGLVLRQARKKLGKTQAEVAELARLSLAFYGRIERSHAVGSLQTFSVLRRILGFDANDLFAAMDVRSARVKRIGAIRRMHKLAQDVGGPYKVFASELYQARLLQRYRQETVARSIQCGPQHYQRIENGHILPSVRMFARLHHRLEFDANRLLNALHETPPDTPRYYRVGMFIAAARKRVGETTIAVARSAGCSPENYASIEAGTRLPTLAELAGMHGLLKFNSDGALSRVRRCEDDGEV